MSATLSEGLMGQLDSGKAAWTRDHGLNSSWMNLLLATGWFKWVAWKFWVPCDTELMTVNGIRSLQVTCGFNNLDSYAIRRLQLSLILGRWVESLHVLGSGATDQSTLFYVTLVLKGRNTLQREQRMMVSGRSVWFTLEGLFFQQYSFYACSITRVNRKPMGPRTQPGLWRHPVTLSFSLFLQEFKGVSYSSPIALTSQVHLTQYISIQLLWQFCHQIRE